MNINIYYIKDYQNFIPLAGYKNKPKQTQFLQRPKSLARKSGNFNKPKKNPGQSRMKWLELQFWINRQFQVYVN